MNMSGTEPVGKLPDQPVRALQYMLGRLSEKYPFLPALAVDGEFGEVTLEAVMLFQRELSPPVTGVVDRRTWEALRDLWRAFEAEQEPPRTVRVFPAGAGRIEPGEMREYMILPQVMFRVLGGHLAGIEACSCDGAHGPASVRNVRWLQRAAGEEETGVMDCRAWDALSRLYEIFVVRSGAGRGQARTWE